ncbi:hypothetical protein KTS45_03960 [Halomicroarcula limicola]|uniref:Uncharacterized protein n=1 Tax=Haloarcula limicola TaxID=1429915 RepID=A0A8J7Y2W7_9EURY|nr:hypothetical protein [Halomicroarcula limicola]MBV0923345.1 hypothetical protein [Halomicroarcula limicola]
MRWQSALLVGLLVTTAGCSGLSGFGDDPRSPTVTPAPVPDPPTATRAQLDFPPGITEDGLRRADVLATTHRQALRNRSYTFYERYRRTTETPNGTVVLARNETTRVADAKRYLHRLHRQRYLDDESVADYRQTTFADGRRWYERSDDGNVTETGGRIRFTQDQFAYEAAFYIEQYAAVPRSRTRIVRRDGDPFFRVTGSGGTPPSRSAVQSYRVSLLVDARGVVHRLEVHYRTETDRVTYSFRYRGFDSTGVSTPRWVDGID